MRCARVVAVLVYTLAAGCASVATAQEAPALILVSDAHFRPGMFATLQEGIRKEVAFHREHAFPFSVSRLVSDRGVLRTVTRMADWEDMNKRQQWASQLPIRPAFSMEQGEATDHANDVFYTTFPGYQPGNPRVPRGEVGFVHETRFHYRLGAGQEVTQIVGKILALRGRYDIRDPSLLWNQVAGHDGPSFSAFTPARDAADFYTQAAQNEETLGAEMQMLVDQLTALCRKVEGVNWTVLQDLTYQPSN